MDGGHDEPAAIRHRQSWHSCAERLGTTRCIWSRPVGSRLPPSAASPADRVWVVVLLDSSVVELKIIDVLRPATQNSGASPAQGDTAVYDVRPGSGVIVPRPRSMHLGRVSLSCVVNTEGMCEDIRVTESLDTVNGLDAGGLDGHAMALHTRHRQRQAGSGEDPDPADIQFEGQPAMTVTRALRANLLVLVGVPTMPSLLAAQTSDGGVAAALSPSTAASVTNMHMTIRRNLHRSRRSDAGRGARVQADAADPQLRELIGHVAAANYLFCSVAKGEPMPSMVNIEKTVTDKAGVVKALGDALTHCDGAYKETTDANANNMVKLPAIGAAGGQSTRAGADVQHHDNNEHYGNVILYLRLKNIVPPSTARALQQKK